MQNLCLSVSELLEQLNFFLESNCPHVRFQGEISEVNVRASVVYLKIKDENSIVSATLWRSQLPQIGFVLEAGQQVTCQGTPNIFARFGSLSIRLSKIELAGEGELRRRFLLLKERLEKEGLFAESRKRELPFFPKCIGVVTSASGAVIHDIMFKVNERMPQTKVLIVDVKVQGESAAQEIAAGVRFLSEMPEVEVLIVGRGGGSLQELWAFNEEEVVRSIFSARVPVVSAVGHESDVTLADFVADRRAPTPTAAAEMVIPSKLELQRQLERLGAALNNIERWLLPKFQAYDFLSDRFKQLLKDFSIQNQSTLEHLGRRLKLIEPNIYLKQSFSNLCALGDRLSRSSTNQVVQADLILARVRDRFTTGLQSVLFRPQHQFAALKARLMVIDHQKILARGYLIARQGGRIVSSAQTLQTNDNLTLQFNDGLTDVLVVKGKNK